MPNLSEFISTISTNLNIANLDAIKLILSSPELAKVELPAEFTDGFNSKYLTEESAKANVNIKNHFTHTALNPVDTSLTKAMEEAGFTDEAKAEINKETSSYKRIGMVVKKMKEMASKSTSEEEKLGFTKEIQRLNAEIVKKDAEKESSIREINTGWVSKLSNQTLTSKIKSQPLYTTDALDIEDVTTLAHNKLEKRLQEVNAQKVFNPETLTYKLVQRENPDLGYFEAGKEVTFDAFLQKTLADAKLLKTTTNATAAAGATPKFITPARTDGDQPKNPLQNRIKSSVDEDLANLTAANA